MLALLATFYQLYLQRLHNEKSLRPYAQIFFWDRDKTLSVQVRNNGLGPLIIDQLTFKKGETIYSTIEDCLTLDPKSYMRISGDDTVQRVILPNTFLTVFEKNFNEQTEEVDKDRIRLNLSLIRLKVACRDMYDNTFTLERDLKWFSRYILDVESKP